MFNWLLNSTCFQDSDHLNFDDFRFSDATIVFPSLSQISASQKEDTPDLKVSTQFFISLRQIFNRFFLKAKTLIRNQYLEF